MLTIHTEVLIVDTKSDLNVYTTAKDDGPATSSCGTKSKPGCCSGGVVSAESAAEVANVDFNEWAGKLYSLFSLLFRCEAPQTIDKVIGSFKIYAIKA